MGHAKPGSLRKSSTSPEHIMNTRSAGTVAAIIALALAVSGCRSADIADQAATGPAATSAPTGPATTSAATARPPPRPRLRPMPASRSVS